MHRCSPAKVFYMNVHIWKLAKVLPHIPQVVAPLLYVHTTIIFGRQACCTSRSLSYENIAVIEMPIIFWKKMKNKPKTHALTSLRVRDRTKNARVCNVTDIEHVNALPK